MLPLQSEAELVCGGFDLVLGLQVIHALCGNAIYRLYDVSNTHLCFDCLSSVSHLHTQRKETQCSNICRH